MNASQRGRAARALWSAYCAPTVNFNPCVLGRTGIGHLVPILGCRRLAGLVLDGGSCPSGGCQVGMAGQLVGPAPAPHGALGGRQASAGYTPANDSSASAQPSSSSSLGSRYVPWLGEGLSMPSPNYPVLCFPLPYRVAPVFV